MDELQPKRVDRIFSIRKDVPDTIFLTCGSFEERCLGVPQRCETNFSERIVLFRFTEPNEKRENLIEEMQSLFKIETFEEKYYTIAVEHGKSTESILKFHNYCKHNSLLGHKNLVITMDITTFTKSLLLDTLFYIRKF